MVKRNSRKVAKGTSYFVNHFLTSASAWFLPVAKTPSSFKIYPGRIIHVDWFDDIVPLHAHTVKDMTHRLDELGPWLTLDEDIFEAILFHWYYLESFRKQIDEGTAEPSVEADCLSLFQKEFQIIWMEVLWRKIKRK